MHTLALSRKRRANHHTQFSARSDCTARTTHRLVTCAPVQLLSVHHWLQGVAAPCTASVLLPASRLRLSNASDGWRRCSFDDDTSRTCELDGRSQSVGGRASVNCCVSAQGASGGFEEPVVDGSRRPFDRRQRPSTAHTCSRFDSNNELRNLSHFPRSNFSELDVGMRSSDVVKKNRCPKSKEGMSYLFYAQIGDIAAVMACIVFIVVLLIMGVTDESRHYLFSATIPLAILAHGLMAGVALTMKINKDDFMKKGGA